MVDWRMDPHAQSMMSLLVAAGVAMHQRRVKGEMRAARGEGLAARVSPALSTVPAKRASVGAAHPTLINHGKA